MVEAITKKFYCRIIDWQWNANTYTNSIFICKLFCQEMSDNNNVFVIYNIAIKIKYVRSCCDVVSLHVVYILYIVHI